MSDEPTTSDKWLRKLKLGMDPILGHIEQERARQGEHPKEVYRGLEHYWYGIWSCELARQCEHSTSLMPCPQRWISRTVIDNDENDIEQWIIPDFTLLLVGEKRKRRLSRRIQARGSNYVIQKTGALVEIKRLPDEKTRENIRKGLGEAYSDLSDQVDVFFRKEIEKGKKAEEIKVVGIYAAGMYWNWKVFTPSTAEMKPLSKNQDATYRTPEGSEASSDTQSDESGTNSSDIDGNSDEQDDQETTDEEECEAVANESADADGHQETDTPDQSDESHGTLDAGGVNVEETFAVLTASYYTLGTWTSDEEMKKVLKAIYELPGAEAFLDEN